MEPSNTSVPGESQQVPAPLADASRLANESSSIWSVPFQLLLVGWASGRVGVFAGPLRAVSVFKPFGSPRYKTGWFSKTDALGAHLSGAGAMES